jgi:hypothetical protein
MLARPKSVQAIEHAEPATETSAIPEALDTHLAGKRAIRTSAIANGSTSTAQKTSSICTLQSASSHRENSLTRATILLTRQGSAVILALAALGSRRRKIWFVHTSCTARLLTSSQSEPHVETNLCITAAQRERGQCGISVVIGEKRHNRCCRGALRCCFGGLLKTIG